MQIKQVVDDTTKKEFTDLPWKIYQNDPNWIPHLKQDIEKVFDPQQNKAHANGKIIRWILQDANEQTIGRIAAFIDYATANTFEQPTGGIGFFECIDSREAAFKLFDTAKDWLQEQGMEAMDGPINFGEKNMFWGLLTENFTDPNSYGMNYNPPYYHTFFEDYGFQVYYNQYMYKRKTGIPVQDSFVEKSERIMSRKGYAIRNAQGMSIEDIAMNFREVYNNAWGGHNNFQDMNTKTAMKIVKQLQPVFDKEIIIFVFYNNKPIAFYVNIPELNEIFRYVNGNLNWWGKLIFLYHKWRRTPQTMVGIVFGVDRKFQGKGVEAAMIKWAEDHVVSLGRYSETVLTWIGDFNPKMLKICENLGATVYRSYATYRYLFDRSKPFERCPIME
ncbi:MAG: hypothetical protein KDD41_01300 [Flavobacteriales bacterium]|nr:hypothetical protein [Flavobacteriales bacterium]